MLSSTTLTTLNLLLLLLPAQLAYSSPVNEVRDLRAYQVCDEPTLNGKCRIEVLGPETPEGWCHPLAANDGTARHKSVLALPGALCIFSAERGCPCTPKKASCDNIIALRAKDKPLFINDTATEDWGALTAKVKSVYCFPGDKFKWEK